jgi:hypothetical protein
MSAIFSVNSFDVLLAIAGPQNNAVSHTCPGGHQNRTVYCCATLKKTLTEFLLEEKDSVTKVYSVNAVNKIIINCWASQIPGS